MWKLSGTTDTSMNSRIYEMEERIPSAKNTIEEIDSTIIQNIKSNKTLTQNTQEICDTTKRPNLKTKGWEGKVQRKSTENIFNKI